MHLREVRDADIGEDFHENTTTLSPRYTGIKGYRPIPQTTSTSRIILLVRCLSGQRFLQKSSSKDADHGLEE